MSDSWKGPSAIIGILGILVTVGIFGYQAWDAKEQRLKDEKKLQEQNNSSLRKEQEMALQAAQKKLNKTNILKEIKRLQEALPKYDDSLAHIETLIKKSNSSIAYYTEELKNPSLHQVLVETYNTVLDSKLKTYKFESADSFRYEYRKQQIKTVLKKLTDSLELYYQ